MDSGPSLAELLRTWRERALLTQVQLADRTGLGVRTIRRLESNDSYRPRGGSQRLLADALELTGAERTQLAAAARGTPVEPVTDPAPVPRQLPADIAGFAGRASALRELDQSLPGAGAPAAVVISAIA